MFKAVVLLALAAAATSEAQAQTVTLPIKPGEDFCFARTYDARHLAAHPKQIVSSIAIMGRNAWKDGGAHANALYASLQIRFRDTGKLLAMNGVCYRSENQNTDSATVTCKFFLGKMQDVLASQLRITWPHPHMMHVTASGDWKVLRRGKEPDGDYGAITTDDRTFDLERRDASSCSFSKIFWTARGPTKALIERLP